MITFNKKYFDILFDTVKQKNNANILLLDQMYFYWPETKVVNSMEKIGKK